MGGKEGTQEESDEKRGGAKLNQQIRLANAWRLQSAKAMPWLECQVTPLKWASQKRLRTARALIRLQKTDTTDRREARQTDRQSAVVNQIRFLSLSSNIWHSDCKRKINLIIFN